jgi:predicted negative regulator of RcsB-dependent stress response
MKSFAVGLLALGTALHAAASTLDAFQEALRRFEARDWTNAASAFSDLAETAPATLQDRCRAYAVRSQAAAKDGEAAFAAAARIQDPHWKAFAEMSALEALGRPDELLRRFRDEPVADWTDALAYRGFLMRGTAAGPVPEAVPDLEQAAALAGSDTASGSRALNRLVEARLAAGDAPGALEAASRLVALSDCRGNYVWVDGVFQKARLLTAARRFDEAEAALELLRDTAEPIFRFRYCEARGDLALARDRREEAENWYRQALELPGVPALYPANLRKKRAAAAE